MTNAIAWTLLAAFPPAALPPQAGAVGAQSQGPLPATGPGAPLEERVRLRDRTVGAGLAGLYTSSATDHSGGIAWIDYNNDYWADLFITNGFGRFHWLFRNNGDGTFTNVTALAPKTNLGSEEAGVCFADIDNDGDSDLFVPVDAPNPTGVLEGGPNALYVNQGGAGFVEQAAAAGVVDPQGRRNITSGFADFDRDGDVDLHCGVWARLLFPVNFNDVLYRNDGMGIFAPVPNSGTTGAGRNALATLWFDADMDAWPDLYVGNVGEMANGYFPPDNYDVFYSNDANGQTFTDATAVGIIGDDATAAMGMDVGDIDNDGDWDLYITDNPVEGAPPVGNVLYLGDGNGGLIDNVCVAAGVCSLNSSWPCNFADFDRDGWVDLWVGTTHMAANDHLFLNRGDGTFEDSTQPAFMNNASRGGSCADYDGDGDVDLCLWRSQQNIKLVRNESLGANHWLELKLFGVLSNRDAIGATVRVTAGGQTQMRRVSGGDSAHSQQELIVHFGLGTQQVCRVEVLWPSGTLQVLPAVAANQLIFVDEVQGRLAEALDGVTCSWSATAQQLALSIDSSFGGRTGFQASGFGPLAWQAAAGTFDAVFGGVGANPGTVTLVSSRGQSFALPVVQVP